ncbi:MAG: HAMP domain-containing protein [Eubacteriales bacterium]|nr:HAMP domain-containing protein [Eubacteriales bacterium]
MIYHPNEEYKNAVIADTDMSDNIKKAFQNKEIGEIVYTNGGEQCHGYLSAIGDTGWMVATGLPEKEFSSIGRSVQTTTIVLFLIALLIVLALIVVISKQIVAPIKKLASVAVKMALGDIDVDVKGISASRDEIGELTEAFDKMVESIRSQSQVSEKIAAGDLSVEVRPRSDKDVLRISMVSVVDTLKKLVEEAEDMTAAALGGRLDNRGDSGQFEGGYREIIEGFNETLDALTGPLKIPAEYMQRISRGDIPPAIADEYKGDFGGERNRGSAGKRCGVCTGFCPGDRP